MNSGYVLAGFETLATILSSFLTNSKGRFENNFTRKDISNFFSKNCSGFLHSYGQDFPNRKSYKTYNDKEEKMFKICRDTGFFDKSVFITDSGGFQVSINRLSIRESEILFDLYYKFLEEKHEIIDRAFILDYPPGPNCEVFKTFDDVYKLNLESYRKAASLSQQVKDKIIYIHHFRTPGLWDIYTKILRDEDMFGHFKYHGTGGIIANLASDVNIPCIIYVLPLIPLINEAIKHKRNYLNFHVLGGANFRDILFYESFKIHVMKTHKIELNITFDSSGLFKGLMVGRYISVMENGILYKMDLRSKTLNTRFKGGKKIVDKFREVLKEFAERNNFKVIPMTDIYSEETGTFYNEIRVYSMLYMLDQFKQMQLFFEEKSRELYPLYELGNSEEFNNKVEILTRSMNSDKITRKQVAKTNSLSKSLDMLTNLDEDYCKYIVNKCLSQTEFVNLLNNKRIMNI